MGKLKSYDKLAFFLPNTFTALNLGCGFMAIMYSMHGEFYISCMLIIAGALFDSVDGRVARMVHAESAFGEQFDSLSDLISFGIAPAIIYYNRFLGGSGRLGMIAAFMFLLCGALRLARFNANIDKVSSDFFQGLPIPGAASAIIGFILVSLKFPTYFTNDYLLMVYIAFYSILMISNIPFSSFKNSNSVKKHKRKILFGIFLLLASVFVYEEIMILIVMSVYVLGCLIFRITNRDKFEDIFNWDEVEDVQP